MYSWQCPEKDLSICLPEEKKLPSQDINTKVILIEEQRIVTTPEVEVISPSSFAWIRMKEILEISKLYSDADQE